MKFDDKDMLYVAEVREGKVVVFNKEGYIINEKYMEDEIEYREYQKNNYRQKDAIGNEYRLSNILWHTRVVKVSTDGKKNIVFQIPLIVWLSKISILVLLLVVFIGAMVILLNQAKSSNS